MALKRRFPTKTVSILVALSMTLSMTLTSTLKKTEPVFAASTTDMITKISTDKAQYSPGSTVTLSVNLKNTTKSTITNGSISLAFKHLETYVHATTSQKYTLKSGASATLTFKWTPPSTDFQGYLVEANCKDASGHVIDSSSVGVDVSSSWLKFPRYGYLTQYGSNISTSSVISQLKDYHINGLQFYDWQWKHHVPVKGDPSNPDSSWNELSNRTVYKSTIENYINNAHKSGMAAMEYNLIYGAVDNYDTDGSGVKKDWGLFNAPGGSQWTMNMPTGWASSALYFFNPLNTDWQKYILDREMDVFKAFNFDGWHADTVGDWGTKYDSKGNPVSITTTFKPFLNYAKSRLGNKLIMMNPVGDKGHYAVNTSNVDAAYTEIWPWDGFPDYNSLKGVVDQAASESGGKSLIVPAYMDYDYSKNKGATDSGYFNTPGVLLTDASVFAAGGSRLELGDDTRMLSNEYFPNRNLKMTAELKAKEKSYYDFLVAYENVLRDGQTNTTNQVSLLGYESSTNGTSNKVWTFTKKDNNYQIIHLINLLGESDTSWRDTNADKPAPSKITNVPVKYYYSGPVGSVYLASPDSNAGKTINLSFTKGTDENGNYIIFNVPSLEYWDMIYISKVAPTAPGNVVNPGFESGDITGWTATGSSYGVDSSDVHSGSYKAYLYSSGAFTQKLEQTIPALQNGTYTVTAWVKQQSGTPKVCRMELSDFGGTTVYKNIAHSTNYQQISATAKVTNGKIKIAFYEDAPGDTNLQIDDVQITKTASQGSLLNGGFENGDAKGWTVAGSNYGVDSADAHSGKYKLWFYGGSDFTQKIDQTVTPLQNGTYTVKAWVKQNTGTPTTCRMELSGYGGSTVYTNISHGDTYQQISGTVNITSGKLNIAFYEKGSGANLQIDDVQLVGTIGNAGFESGTISNWTTTGNYYGIDSSDVHSGKYKCWFYGGGNFSQKLEQTIYSLENGTYTVKAWVKQNTGTPTTCRLELSDFGATPIYKNISHGDVYQQITATAKVTNGTLKITFNESAASGANLQIDDVDLVKN